MAGLAWKPDGQMWLARVVEDGRIWRVPEFEDRSPLPGRYSPSLYMQSHLTLCNLCAWILCRAVFQRHTVVLVRSAPGLRANVCFVREEVHARGQLESRRFTFIQSADANDLSDVNDFTANVGLSARNEKGELEPSQLMLEIIVSMRQSVERHNWSERSTL